MCEATLKKVKFLNFVIDNLKLNNITTVCDRLENVSRETFFREKFDFVVSRAVSSLKILVELTVPFLKNGGYLIAYKGEKAQIELDESNNIIKNIGAKFDKIINFNIRNSNSNLILIKKIHNTKSIYPRKYSLIIKK